MMKNKSVLDLASEFSIQCALAAERAPAPCSLSATPQKESIALACHPKRAREFEEDATKRGVPTEFKANGSPVFTSRRHQRAYIKAYFGDSIINRSEIY